MISQPQITAIRSNSVQVRFIAVPGAAFHRIDVLLGQREVQQVTVPLQPGKQQYDVTVQRLQSSTQYVLIVSPYVIINGIQVQGVPSELSVRTTAIGKYYYNKEHL